MCFHKANLFLKCQVVQLCGQWNCSYRVLNTQFSLAVLLKFHVKKQCVIGVIFCFKCAFIFYVFVLLSFILTSERIEDRKEEDMYTEVLQ